jgi:glycine/D-amino acid oxidase-like deaminating enzyme
MCARLIHRTACGAGDGTATSSDLCASLAAGAKQKGVEIHERTRVTAIQRSAQGTAIKAVVTNRGTIQTEIIVNCAGQWARNIGQMAGVSVPLHSAEHFYIVTRPLQPAVSPMLPVMRDPDVYTYYRYAALRLPSA